MCLLLSHPAGLTLPDELVNGIFARNSDGIGVMWAEDNKLRYRKALPKTATEALAFYKENIAGKECVAHWRMQTHGRVDYENCHPYPVFGFDKDDAGKLIAHENPILLMHNGVLHSGNTADTTKSDTWHYIRDYLRPMLNGNPGFAFNPAFDKIIGAHIGTSNRFALMDAAGQVTIVNKQTGHMYMGAWFSNTYAWDANTYLYGRSAKHKSWDAKTGWSDADDAAYDSWKARHSVHGNGYVDYSRTRGSKAMEIGRAPEVAATPPKSKGQLKREAKAAARLTKAFQPGGTVTPLIGHSTTPEKGSGKQSSLPIETEEQFLNRVSHDETGEGFIAQEYVDDVLEMRSILDVAYNDNETRDKQLVMLLEEMGPTRCYKALQLLLDGKIKPSMWNHLTNSVRAARAFAHMPENSWDNVPEGKFNSRNAVSEGVFND